jgi:general secretion pathway protein E
MAAVAPISSATPPAAEGSLDDRICQFLVAQGHLKETDPFAAGASITRTRPRGASSRS